MLRSRTLAMTLLAFVILATLTESASLVRRSISEAFNSPFHVIGKRNQFYGLFKKLSYDSLKPVYLQDGFGLHQ
ncbi:hypothetical protein ANCCAN_24406 [Ancylostoma caninum]|uniref:Uncharacterized protein n=1 Tax=Ancylostoma caninum TaxID=29170 RepID=A0A368FCI5_ANCCA|nr:hypothetical protein ANCCAN_24406 [Ancylostoma caninum]